MTPTSWVCLFNHSTTAPITISGQGLARFCILPNVNLLLFHILLILLVRWGLCVDYLRFNARNFALKPICWPQIVVYIMRNRNLLHSKGLLYNWSSEKAGKWHGTDVRQVWRQHGESCLEASHVYVQGSYRHYDKWWRASVVRNSCGDTLVISFGVILYFIFLSLPSCLYTRRILEVLIGRRVLCRIQTGDCYISLFQRPKNPL